MRALLLLLLLLLSYAHSYSRPKLQFGKVKSNIAHKTFQLYESNSKLPTTIMAENEEFENDILKTVATVALSGGFAVLLGLAKGQAASIEFVSGYLLELCLSVDNLIVFILLFESFQVSKSNQDRILTYGIIGAVILRGIFVVTGAAAIQSFNQVLGVFAFILAYSSYKILFQSEDEDDEDISQQPIVKFSKKYLRTTDKLDGNKFFIQENGVMLATPLFLCLVCVELSDILFAFDSVPAIFGVTTDPLVVYTSNIFAIMGLRSLFGVLTRLIDDLEYLDKAVGVVLLIISAKLGAEVFGLELLTPLQSLIVVLATLGTGVAASLMKRKQDDEKLNITR